MTTRIVVLGAGTGGTLTANRLRKAYAADEVEITVVDRVDIAADTVHLADGGTLSYDVLVVATGGRLVGQSSMLLPEEA